MGPIGMKELVILLVVVLIIFGPKRLPGLGRAIGQSIKEFKEGVKGLGNVLEEDAKDQGQVASTDHPAPEITEAESKPEETAKS